jgi:hypothetical protein
VKNNEAFILINQMIGMLMLSPGTNSKKLVELGEWTKTLIRKEK